jgi:hypothetical protein
VKILYTQAITAGSSSDMTISIIESEENQEDTIDFHYFHADIIRDSLGGEIRITVASEAAIIVVKPISTSVEILWHQLKEVFINQIFLNSKQNKGIRIRNFVLESYYNWINKARGVLTKTSLSYKVRWFLGELLMVAPNSSIRKIGQLLEANKQKLLKQYLLANMDSMILNLKTIATKLKNTKSARPGLHQLLKISESGTVQIDNYSFLRHLLLNLFDEEDEIIKQHIALLDRIHAKVHSTYQEILIDGVQRHLEKLGEEDNTYYDILITDLQESMENVDRRESLLKKVSSKKDDLIIAEFISDSNGDKLEIETKNFKVLKQDKEFGINRIEDFEYFILTEIEKAVKYSEQNILSKKYEDISSESKNVINGIRKNIHTGKSNEIGPYSLRNQRKTEEKNKIQSSFQREMNFLQTIADIADTKLEEMVVKDEQKGILSSVDSVSDDINKLHVSDMFKTMDISNVRISPSKRQTMLQKTQRDVRDTQCNDKTDLRTKLSNRKDLIENKITSTDPLEEFQKFIWIINEKKNIAQFKKKLQIPSARYDITEPRQLKYEKKYTDKDKNKGNKLKSHIVKHIDDEL